MSASSVSLEGGVLFIGESRIELPYPVAEIVECSDSIIARVDPPPGEIFNRNVFAFTRQGDCIWQIQESPHGTEKDKPYVGISHGERGQLVAANWNGVDYFVDIDSGNITTKAFNK